MYKKTLLSVAIASALSLTGCLDTVDPNNPKEQENAGSVTNPVSPEQQAEFDAAKNGTYPVFSPATSELPLPNDLIFDQDAKDGTFKVSDSTPPVTTAINQISGASTSAAIDIEMSGLITAGSLKGKITDGPLQNVFLIELAYASGSPLQGLLNKEAPTVVAPTSVDYEAVEVELDGTSYIRINPLVPLKPNTRYVVAVTNEVTDDEGNPIIQQPGLAAYAAITDADRGLADPALQPVRDLMNGLWEPIALNYFAAATNPQRTAASLAPLTADNIALSYSFTTSGDEKVLEYIANPTEWFTDQLNSFVRVSASKAVIAANSSADYATIKTAADGAVSTFPDAGTAAALGTIFGDGAPCNALIGAGPTAISCAASVLTGGFAAMLPTPKAQTVSIDDANAKFATVKSVILSSFDPTNAVKVVEGSIELPYYLGVPSDGDGSTINASNWAADSTLATALNTSFAAVNLVLPQAFDSLTTNLNYIFPFPAKTGTVTAPLLATYNHAAVAADSDTPVVIYQHGIQLDRSAMLAQATSLSAQGYTVIGIDQPIHGIIPPTSAAQDALAGTLLTSLNESNAALPGDTPTNRAALILGQLTNGVVQAMTGQDAGTAAAIIAEATSKTFAEFSAGAYAPFAAAYPAILPLEGAQNAVANAGSTIPGIGPMGNDADNERHFGFTADATLQPVEVGSTNAAGGSGSLFINLTGFTNSRDKLRQGSIDLMNLTSSLASIDLDNDGDADLDTSKVYFMGQSLGTVNGIPFVSSWNAAGSTPNITAAALQVPGGGLVKFLENSAYLSPAIITGLAANGVNQGSGNFELFTNILQATLDTVDPINHADNLNSACAFDNTVTVDGLNTFQTCSASTNLLITEISGSATRLPDLVIANETYNNTLDSSVPSAKSALSGTDPLVKALGADNILEGTSASQLVSRYAQGSHGSFVLPKLSDTETVHEGSLAMATEDTINAEREAVFQANMVDTLTLFAAGTVPAATNAAILNDEATHTVLRAPR